MSRSSDIPLEPPLVSSTSIVRAKEDRSYLGYIAAAIASALGGGFVFAMWVPLASTGTVSGGDRVPWMVQAHGWVMLQGWAGLFVAGMAIRLIPRFAGRRPIPRTVTVPLLALLVFPIVLRIAFETWAAGGRAELVANLIGWSSAAGQLGVASVLAYTLAKGRRPRDPWRYFAWAGTFWWAVWACLSLANIPGGGALAGLVPHQDNDILLWIVMLGPIGNFIWGVQSRSVPVFYGRGTPNLPKLILPGIALNFGVAFLALSLLNDANGLRWSGLGFALSGSALLWLPAVAGSVYGEARRLRPRARSAARFLIAANVAAMLAGALLLWAGFAVLVQDSSAPFAAFNQRDAARHLFGIGTITMLILGMARLVAPFFALERTESGVPRFLEGLPFWFLLAAVVLRAGVPLLGDSLDYEAGRHIIATAGSLAWAAIAIFAFSVARAIRAEPRTKVALEHLAANARKSPG
ncbi:MAG: NnrS family protein [Dehalococcoidia bacterium]